MKRQRIQNRLLELLAWLLSLMVLLPFAIVFLNTFKDSIEAAKFTLTLPKSFSFANYAQVIQECNMLRPFLNSMIMSFFPTVINVVMAAMAAFVIARTQDKLSRALYYFFFFGLMAPMNYIPTTMLLKTLGLSGSFLGIILLLAAAGIPFAFFLFYGFMGSLNREIDEAAVIDGCGGMRLFFSIIFPLLKPVTVTAFVLNFLGCWNDFKTPLYVLNSSNKWGMIMNMYGYFGVRQSDWNLVCTVIVLTLLPVLLLYIFGQRYIIDGMTAGAVKG